jgi:hypothetical protein
VNNARDRPSDVAIDGFRLSLLGLVPDIQLLVLELEAVDGVDPTDEKALRRIGRVGAVGGAAGGGVESSANSSLIGEE